MSPNNFSRDVINALFPEGSIWVPQDDEGLDQLLDGISLNLEEMRDFLALLAKIRNPFLTPILSDLEKEYGLPPNTNLSLEERQQRLLSAITNRSGFGADYMQEKLQRAGFNVQVHVNNPPIDPRSITGQASIYCNDQVNAFCGNENAVSGGMSGEIIVNQDWFYESSVFSLNCGGEFAKSGSNRALCGKFDLIKREGVIYTIPTNPGYWGLIFFVGGNATRIPPVTGPLTNIDPADVPATRREELKELIIKYKPSHSWCILIANYI